MKLSQLSHPTYLDPPTATSSIKLDSYKSPRECPDFRVYLPVKHGRSKFLYPCLLQRSEGKTVVFIEPLAHAKAFSWTVFHLRHDTWR